MKETSAGFRKTARLEKGCTISSFTGLFTAHQIDLGLYYLSRIDVYTVQLYT
jgi:hypothetical protein